MNYRVTQKVIVKEEADRHVENFEFFKKVEYIQETNRPASPSPTEEGSDPHQTGDYRNILE